MFERVGRVAVHDLRVLSAVRKLRPAAAVTSGSVVIIVDLKAFLIHSYVYGDKHGLAPRGRQCYLQKYFRSSLRNASQGMRSIHGGCDSE